MKQANEKSNITIDLDTSKSRLNNPNETMVEIKSPKRNQTLDQAYQMDYKPANFIKGLQFMNQNSYKNKNLDGTFEIISVLENNAQLKKFGVGLYLYLEFFKRLTLLFFIFSLFEAIPIALDVIGTGLSQQSFSYGTYLIQCSLGNYNSISPLLYDVYILSGIHCLIGLVLLIFLITWKVHHTKEITQFETNNSIVHAKKFCIEIQNLPRKGITNQQLKAFFTTFGPVYECSLVYDYKDKLKYFQQVDELDQRIKQTELEYKLGNKDTQKLQKLKTQKKQLAEKINNMKISPSILSCYVHFEFQQSKNATLNYYNEHYLFSGILHSFMRGLCCCFVPDMDPKFHFHGQKLKIKNEKVPAPQQINWQSIDVGSFSKIIRIIIAFLVIIVFLAISSTLVALCSILINTNAINCSGVTGITYAMASNTTNSTIITCYCNQNLLNFRNSTISTLCSSTFNTIYFENALQIVAALISTATNIGFTFLVKAMVDFTKPENLSSSLISKTFIIFLVKFINSAVLPLLIYANIYGFQIASYVSLIPSISVISSGTLTYYDDFSTMWYMTVSPYFTNFMIINIIMSWVLLLKNIIKKRLDIRSAQSNDGKILQKQMNMKLTNFEIDIVDESSEFYFLIYLSLMYNAGVPILVPLCTIALASRYFINKYLILNHSAKISGLNQNFNQFGFNLLPFAIFISCYVGSWMFTANKIFYPNMISVNIPGSSVVQNSSNVFPRVFYFSYTLLLGAIVIFYIFIYHTLVRFIYWLISLFYKVKEIHPQDMNTVKFSTAALTLNMLTSYNIHNNPKYKNPIISLQKYLEWI